MAITKISVQRWSWILLSTFPISTVCQSVTTRETLNHPPIPTATLPPLPSQFRDIPEESNDCWNSYYSYSFTNYFLRTEFAKSATTITTTFATPRTITQIYTYNHEVDCSTAVIGLTTLCDGIPRVSRRDRNCRTVPTTRTDSWLDSQAIITHGPTWTSEFVQPMPTCQVAPDLDPLCNRMMMAWEWRTSIWRSNAPLPTDVPATISNAVPHCTPLNTYTSSKPWCRMSVSSWVAYHWPKPTPTGSEFCQPNWVEPTGTPTVPGKPNTAIISGHTLTSPSVYLFYKKVQIETFVGYAANPYSQYPYGYEVWKLSTSIPANRPLTAAQMEDRILTASEKCEGREADYCTIDFDTAFRVRDMSTVRADLYKKQCGYGFGLFNCATVDQALYRPTIGVPMTEVARQNGLFEDCEWSLYDYGENPGYGNTYSSSSTAMLSVKAVATGFLPIATAA